MINIKGSIVRKLIATLLIIFFGAEHILSQDSSPSTSKEDAGLELLSLSPADFAVPKFVVSPQIERRFAGQIVFESPSFEAWLKRNGRFGALVALNDKSLPPNDKDGEIVLGGKDGESKKSLYEELRICDYAYVILRKRHRLKPLSYRHTKKARDQLIEKLISIEQAKQKDRKGVKQEDRKGKGPRIKGQEPAENKGSGAKN